MKTKKKLLTLALVSFAAAMSGCGKSNNDQPGAGAPGYGGWGGTMVPAAGGCVPLQQAISFVGQNAYFDSASIVAGNVGNQSVGQMQVGTGGGPGVYTTEGPRPTACPSRMYGGYNSGGTCYNNGSLTMNISQGGAYPGYTGYPNQQMPFGYPQSPWQGGSSMSPNQAQINGVLTLSPAAVQEIQSFMGTGYNPNPYYPQQPVSTGCVSGIAVNMGHYNQTLYGGYVILTFSNSPIRGYALGFGGGVNYPIQ